MDDIARLLGDLAGGRLTAAVPLLDLFRERGMEWEAGELQYLVGAVLEEAEKDDGFGARFRIAHSAHREKASANVALRVRHYFWHLMADRSDRLAEVEAWLAGPGEPQPEGQGGGRPLDGDRLVELWRTMPPRPAGWPTPGG